MNRDPTVRLAALHSDNAAEALEILFPDEPAKSEAIDGAIRDAIVAFTEAVDDAICRGMEEVQLDLEVAQLIALALKSHKQKHGAPRKSKRGRLLRSVTILIAERREAVHRAKGHGVEEARKLAAEEASACAAKSGDYVSAATIVREMKEAGAKRNKEAAAAQQASRESPI